MLSVLDSSKVVILVPVHCSFEQTIEVFLDLDGTMRSSSDLMSPHDLIADLDIYFIISDEKLCFSTSMFPGY